jgi:hypothetical protein
MCWRFKSLEATENDGKKKLQYSLRVTERSYTEAPVCEAEDAKNPAWVFAPSLELSLREPWKKPKGRKQGIPSF